MSILRKIKDEVSKAGQRALGIDELRFKADTVISKMDTGLAKLDGLDRVEAEIARTNEQILNLKNFLTWYSNRVEPWFWTGNFSRNNPEEELAGLLFNFLPGRVLVDVSSKTASFAKAATAIGYEVFSVAPPNTIASLASAKTLPTAVDFINIGSDNFNIELVKSLDWMQPAIIQAEFVCEGLQSNRDLSETVPFAPVEIISEMRNREYYWSVVIFRTEAEGFVRMATNLAGVPNQAWGNLLFFHDHQLFLKAVHWCKTTLPRFRAAPLAR